MNSPYCAVALQQWLAALRAGLFELHGRLLLDLLGELADGLAGRVGRVVRAAHEGPPGAVAEDHLLAAVVAELLLGHVVGARGAKVGLGGEVFLREVAADLLDGDLLGCALRLARWRWPSP